LREEAAFGDHLRAGFFKLRQRALQRDLRRRLAAAGTISLPPNQLLVMSRKGTDSSIAGSDWSAIASS
jgi:hypothetical protein